jgi:hypothetical protein
MNLSPQHNRPEVAVLQQEIVILKSGATKHLCFRQGNNQDASLSPVSRNNQAGDISLMCQDAKLIA